MKNASYVEAARLGKHRGWRYLLGLVVILFSWIVVASAVTTLVAFVLDGQEGIAALGRMDFSAFGSVAGFFVFMSGSPFVFVGILIAVSLIHRRHPRTLVTAREKISWHRVGQGFVAWFVPFCLVIGLGQYLFYPNSFSFNSDLATFALFVPLALVLTAIQTTFEELFFRGYIVQGASLISTNRVFLALVAAVIFTLPHLANPEASGWLAVFLNYFFGAGLVWSVVSLIDGTTELSIGAHFANNIANALAISATGTVFTAPALFLVSEYHATFYELSQLVLVPLFLAIAYKVFKRDEASEPVSQNHWKGYPW